jgi:hypothetical protein
MIVLAAAAPAAANPIERHTVQDTGNDAVEGPRSAAGSSRRALVATSGLAMIAPAIATIASAVLITIVSASMTLGRKRPGCGSRGRRGRRRSAACRRALARSDRRSTGERAGAGAQPARWPTSAALQAAGDRDVVVMTARLIDVDVPEDAAGQSTPTA